MARNVSRKKVLILGGIAFAVIVGAGALIYSAMSENVVFFYSPTQVAAGEAPHDHTFRVGGMVKKGTVATSDDGVTTSFTVTDDNKDVQCIYKGPVRREHRCCGTGQAERFGHVCCNRSAREA